MSFEKLKSELLTDDVMIFRVKEHFASDIIDDRRVNLNCH